MPSNLAYYWACAVHGNNMNKETVCGHPLQMSLAIPVISVRTMTENCVFGFVATVWEGSNRVFHRTMFSRELLALQNSLMTEWGCQHMSNVKPWSKII